MNKLVWPQPKDPGAVLDYEMDWTLWLDGDTLATSTWTVGAGITKASDSHTTTIAKIWLAGGTAGQDYDCLNQITTAAGRSNERTGRLLVRER